MRRSQKPLFAATLRQLGPRRNLEIAVNEGSPPVVPYEQDVEEGGNALRCGRRTARLSCFQKLASLRNYPNIPGMYSKCAHGLLDGLPARRKSAPACEPRPSAASGYAANSPLGMTTSACVSWGLLPYDLGMQSSCLNCGGFEPKHPQW